MLERASSGQWLAIGASCVLHVVALVVVQTAASYTPATFKKILVADLTLVEPPPAPPSEPDRPPAPPAPRRLEPPRVIELPRPVVQPAPEPEKVEPPPVAAPPSAPTPAPEVAAAPVEAPAAPPAAPPVSLPRAEPVPSGNATPSAGLSLTTAPPSPPPPAPRVAAVPPPSVPSLGEAVGSGLLGVLDRPRPRYPAPAKSLRAQGTTVLKVRVLETGRAGDIQVEESAGHPALDEAAREAVGRWRFMPGKENGRPIALWVLIPIEFRLR